MIYRSLSLVALVLLLVALPAGAELYTITLHNGNTFQTRYKPEEASFDKTKLTLLTDMGNQISLSKEDVAQIIAETERKGFGFVIDTTTVALGWSPNDAPTPEELEALAQQQALQPQRPQMPVFNTQQFAEPDTVGNAPTGGIPVGFIGTTTPPIGQPTVTNY